MDNRSPNDFPTTNLGSKDWVVWEKPVSMANLSSPTVLRIFSSTPTVLPIAIAAVPPNPEDGPVPVPEVAVFCVVTPKARRLTMSVRLNGGSDVKSTSGFSMVPVTRTAIL